MSPAKTAATPDLAALRRRRAELVKEFEAVSAKRAALQRQLLEGVAPEVTDETMRAIIAGETDGLRDPAELQLSRLDAQRTNIARAVDVLDLELARFELRESIAAAAPAFAAAEALIPKLADWLDEGEEIFRKAEPILFEALQRRAGYVSGLSRFPAETEAFDARRLELLLEARRWFMPFDQPVSPATSDEAIRSEMFLSPPLAESWRRRAHELGVKLSRPAMHPSSVFEKAPRLPRPNLGRLVVRMRTAFADAIGSASPGEIVELEGAQASDLVAGSYADVVEPEDLERHKLELKARWQELQRRRARADVLGQVRIDAEIANVERQLRELEPKKHLAAAAVPAGGSDVDDPARDDEWTPTQ